MDLDQISAFVNATRRRGALTETAPRLETTHEYTINSTTRVILKISGGVSLGVASSIRVLVLLLTIHHCRLAMTIIEQRP